MRTPSTKAKFNSKDQDSVFFLIFFFLEAKVLGPIMIDILLVLQSIRTGKWTREIEYPLPTNINPKSVLKAYY